MRDTGSLTSHGEIGALHRLLGGKRVFYWSYPLAVETKADYSSDATDS